ncbi:MAG: HAD hydrolase family protein [Clostridia bacterium]|jgi:3-deoxy-D-manno-octulosonate 8-phosphate phosphatase (KDO 8-P phosphatase)|nr:HAD hydrolase family protein [Clostridia bacterium]
MVFNKNISDAVERAKKVKLVIFDIHGVLTTIDVIYDQDGRRQRIFCHDDLLGSNLLRFSGIEIAVITKKTSAQQRIDDMGIKRFYMIKDKIKKYEQLLQELKLTDEEVCYVGDDLIDLLVMKRVGFAVTPADGKKPAKEAAHYITEKAGGKGVVRELAEFIMEAQGKMDSFYKQLSTKGWPFP